jgi:predicted nucleic acid-binding protein
MYLADTNILIRFLLRNDPSYQPIRRAVTVLKRRREQIFTTPQNMREFWNVCTRPAHQRGGLGLSVAATELRLRLLERHFPVLPDSLAIYSQWKLLVASYGVIGVQVHDAHLVAAMIVHGLSRIITLNGTDFTRYAGVTALAPRDIT